MDITNYDEKAFTYVPTYGDEYTGYNCCMISFVVFLYSNALKIMLVDYVGIEMGCFDYYSDAAPCSKTMRGNYFTTFLLYIPQCINFYQKMLLHKHLFTRHR